MLNDGHTMWFLDLSRKKAIQKFNSYGLLFTCFKQIFKQCKLLLNVVLMHTSQTANNITAAACYDFETFTLNCNKTLYAACGH